MKKILVGALVLGLVGVAAVAAVTTHVYRSICVNHVCPLTGRPIGGAAQSGSSADVVSFTTSDSFAQSGDAAAQTGVVQEQTEKPKYACGCRRRLECQEKTQTECKHVDAPKPVEQTTNP